MTPRQRWLATLAGEQTDRLATDYWSTPEFTARLRQHLGPASEGQGLFDMLGIDNLCSPWPKHRPAAADGTDMWGIRLQRIEYGTGAYEEVAESPLAQAQSVRDVDNHAWPDPAREDYSPIAEAIERNNGHRMVRGGHYEPFLLYCRLRGMEQAYEDLVENPDIAHAILGHIFNYHYERNRRIFEAGGGKIDLFYLAEDLGGQHGPLFGLETYRRFLRPGQQKMAELVHQHGAKVFYHTDGAARMFLPDLIEVVRIDILNPLQWRCPGMDLPQLVRDFSPHIAFHGGIDNQQTLPFGTADEVRQQVRWCAQIMQEHNARWICAPCHNIQPVTPVDNVLAMYDEASRISRKVSAPA